MQVHRFGDDVAVHLANGGQLKYLSVGQAIALSNALLRVVADTRLSFAESKVGTIPIE